MHSPAGPNSINENGWRLVWCLSEGGREGRERGREGENREGVEEGREGMREGWREGGWVEGREGGR